MGIRDRIAGFRSQAGDLLQTVAAAVSGTVPSSGTDAGTDDAPVNGTRTRSGKSSDAAKNFSEEQLLLDTEALSRSLQDDLIQGTFGDTRFSHADIARSGMGIDMSQMGRDVLSNERAAQARLFEIAKGRSTGNLTDESDGASGGNAAGLAVGDPKALYWDPFALVQQLGFRERPSAMTFATLRSVAWRVPIIQAILQTRINQVSAFATLQHHKFETGFRIKLRDIEAKPTAADKKEIERMERMILGSGVETGNHVGRDSFEMFLRKVTRDSLTLDAACWEIVPDGRGRPAEWYAVDAATIRLADTSKLYPDDDIESVKTVQIYDNVIIGEFNAIEMAYMTRNARTDIQSYGYGTAEIEMIVSTVTAILWAWQYNQNFFSNGSVAKGLLNLKGAIPEKQLRAFRRQWYQMVSGVENAFRTPITNAEEIDWISMQASNRDMEYSSWMDFLIKVCCSVFVLDPVEINFKYGNSGGGGKSMFEGAQRAKSQESRERGLKPLLRAIGREIDRTIIWPNNADLTIEFVGLESQTPKELADLMTQRVRTLYTIDELRAENDMDPLPDGMGALILDANWINARNTMLEDKKQADAEAKMAQQAALGGGPGAPGGGPGGVSDLEGMLAQLQGKPAKLGTPDAGVPAAGKKPPPGVPDGAHGAGKPRSIPAQTPRQIAAELAGSGTGAPVELSRNQDYSLAKSSIIEIDL